jgi:Raf kinase inhibitor-like YbhB/YbcL family protein
MRAPAILAIITIAACGGGASTAEANVNGKEPSAPGGKVVVATMRLTSTAFQQGAAIPKQHTCQGNDVSVPLAWDAVPAGAKSLVLIVDDPDAPDPSSPKQTWVHWVLSLPAETRSLASGASKALPPGASMGKNDWGKDDWGGPCPPIGRHRYLFKLYAVDQAVDARGKDKAAVLAAIDGHVLARGELTGTYQKKK